MTPFDLPRGVVDRTAYENTVAHLRKGEIRLPTLSELADPARLPPSVMAATRGVGADDPHPANLLRVHWYNDAARAGLTAVPGHLVLDRALTGVAAPIVVVLGERFPMIGAHKVLAAYACLVTRLVTG